MISPCSAVVPSAYASLRIVAEPDREAYLAVLSVSPDAP